MAERFYSESSSTHGTGSTLSDWVATTYGSSGVPPEKPASTGKDRLEPAVDIVWGVGGERGPALLGGLRWLEDKHVKTGTETGVSAGSIVAAFHTNGYSSKEIAEIFVKEFNKPDGRAVINAVTKGDDFGEWLSGGARDAQPFFKRLVETYHLKPNEHLQIVAYDTLNGGPVVFKGRDYDLSTALAASTGLPGHLAPTMDWSDWWPKMLVDGGMYKLNPFEFSRHGAIAFAVEQDTAKMREDAKNSNYFVRDFIEDYIDRMLGRWSQPVPDGDRVVSIKLDHSDTPRMSNREVRRMMNEGYRQASQQLKDYSETACYLPQVELSDGADR